jgi:FkbM family methyltransferase
MFSIPKRFAPKRLSLKTAIKLRIHYFLKNLLKPDFNESYSQVGEDMAIKYILEDLMGVRRGFYIDVGCNHPVHISNSFKLYVQNWKGLTIDLNKDLILQHQTERRDDIQVHSAVSDEEKEVTVYEFDDHAVNTIDADAYSKAAKNYNPKTNFSTIRTKTLNQILQENNIKDVDLLLIDVEGHDLNVLKSIDFNKYRPKLIVVEVFIYDMAKVNENELVRYMQSMGYTMYGYLIANAYFVDGNKY